MCNSPRFEPRVTAVAAYIVFMTLNIVGVTIAATFELFVTILAVVELLIFIGVVAPGFEWANFVKDGWGGQTQFGPAALGGIVAAVPFAICSSSPSKELPWQPKRSRIRGGRFPKPISLAS